VSVVLITGCSSGIGLEAALAFARRGDTTYASMRNLARADRLRARADAEGLALELLVLDVTDEDSVKAAVADVEGRHGAVDVLVNNAGVGFFGSVEDMDLSRAATLIDTNVWGAVRTTRAVLPAMRARRSGVIVNVTSVAGRVPGVPYQGFYSASKHALGTLSEALHWEVAPFGLRVVCVEPGFFATDIISNADNGDVRATSPYAADHAWLVDFYLKAIESDDAPPAAIVADAIVQAVGDPATPLHNLVGDDAKLYVDLAAQAGSYEGFVPIATSIIEGVAGPRPAQPA
jgi:NAD(P)-dependent dehydrogenase (short-subunit alcohol dehydrogenase family)